MMNYGEYRIEDLPPYDGSSIDGIRIAFHKKDRHNALELCRLIKKKGYLVFIQAMVSLSYTDAFIHGFISLIINMLIVILYGQTKKAMANKRDALV